RRTVHLTPKSPILVANIVQRRLRSNGNRKTSERCRGLRIAKRERCRPGCPERSPPASGTCHYTFRPVGSNHMAKTLSGKVALVTGASRGIGAATARALADEGANVAISYSASADKAEALVRELEGKGVRAAAFKADQGDPAQVDGLVKSVAKRFGRLDILVNNAGVFEMGNVDDPGTDGEKFDRQYAINVGGLVAAVRAAVKVM